MKKFIKDTDKKKPLLLLLFLGIIIRVLVAYISGVSNTDMSIYYIPWAHSLLKEGIGNVYLVSKIDYPPLYLYFLYLLALVENFLWPHNQVRGWPVPNVTGENRGTGLLYKTPLILADILLAVFVYKLLSFKKPEERKWTFGALVLNPALIYISSAWGQTDGLLLTILLISIFFLLRARNFLLSFLFFWLGFFLKTQTIFFLPFYFFYFLKSDKKRVLAVNLFLSLCLALLIIYPFLQKLPLLWLPKYYLHRAKTWEITSIYATSLIGLLFGNYQSDLAPKNLANLLKSSPFIFSLVLLTSFFSFLLIFLSLKIKRARFFKSAFLLKLLFFSVLMFFYFSSRMHSRFLIYPTILSFMVFKEKRLLIPLGLSFISLLQMLLHFDIQLTPVFNTAWFKTVIMPTKFFLLLNYLMLLLVITTVLDFFRKV